MADEQKPEGLGAPPPAGSEASAPAEKPAAPAAKPAAPKPAAAAHAAPPKPPATMAATPWDSDLAQLLKERFGDRYHRVPQPIWGRISWSPSPMPPSPMLEYLKLEADFDYLVDITAVDWPKRAERFDLVYIVYSFARNERMRIKTISRMAIEPRHRRRACT